MITSNNLIGIWSLRDGRRVSFSPLNHAELIYVSEALEDHSVTDKGRTLGCNPLMGLVVLY